MKLNSITYKNRNTPIEDWRNYSCCDSNAMGNILRQIRHNRNGDKFDDLSYKYQKDGNGNLQRNRLYHVNDAIASSLDSTDIDDMGVFVSAVNQINTDNNYSYDAEGRLVKDKQEEIDTILWTVTGKVREIHRTDTSKKKNLVFDYDAFGRRIAKHIYNNETSMLEKSTYYILDASGNQLSIYEHRIDTANNAATYYLTERNIYGSSRLGVVNDTVNLFVPTLLPSYGIVGNRTYELSNHLGNVLTVINDIKYPVSDDNVTISGFEVGIAGISDYSPFGAPLDGRTIQNSNYRYGWQKMESDPEIKGEGNSYTTEYRQYDPRLGRWLTLDPLSRNFPWISPYAGMENNPIKLTDPKGLAAEDFVKKANGSIYWDKNANSQETTKEGETYLGKTLNFEFKSYIDGKLWDGPMGQKPVGTKLTSTITLKAEENSDGEITNVSASFNVKLGKTPVGTARDFYPGKGGENNQRKAEQTKNENGIVQQFKLTFEQHASVSPEEEFGMNQMGYKIVDVAQKLNLVFNQNHLWIGSYTDIFPSATLTVNGHKVMQYNQPSFVDTHTAPTTWDYLPPFFRKDFSYYPSKLFLRK